MTEEQCQECIHRPDCSGSSLQYGDCCSGGPYGNEDPWPRLEVAELATCKMVKRVV